MKSWKKYLALTFSALLIAGALAGCGSSTPSSSQDTKQPLRVATNATYVPFEFKNDSNSDYQGFEIDMIKAAAKHIGRDIEFRNIQFSGLIPALMSGDVDVAASGMTIKAERMEKVLFSSPYYESQLVIITRKDNATINSSDDLTGRQVAVQAATIAAEYAEKYGAVLKQFDTNTDALMELKAGGSEAVVTDKPVAEYFAAKLANEDMKIIPAANVHKAYYAFSTKKENQKLMDQLNKALDEMRKNGEYAEIYKKWFGSEPTDMPKTPEEAIKNM